MDTPIPNVRKATEPARDASEAGSPSGGKICIIGASGKLGRYLVQHALDRGYEVVAVCREVSVEKLEEFSGRVTIIPERRTTDRSSSARSRGATPSSRCWLRAGSTTTHSDQSYPHEKPG